MGSISFSKFKMAAATIFDFGYQAFFDIVDVLLFVAATSPPNSVKIGQKWQNDIKYGGSRRVESRIQGVFQYQKMCYYSK